MSQIKEMENTEPKNVMYVILSKNTNLFLISRSSDKETIKLGQNDWEEHFKNYPTLAFIFYGLGFLAFGVVLSLTIIGVIVGLPLIIVGFLMAIVGVIRAVFDLTTLVKNYHYQNLRSS